MDGLLLPLPARDGGDTGDLGGVLIGGVIGRLVGVEGEPEVDEATTVVDPLLAVAGLACVVGVGGAIVALPSAAMAALALLSAAAAAKALLSAVEGVGENIEDAAGGDGGGDGRIDLDATDLVERESHPISPRPSCWIVLIVGAGEMTSG